jgi:hypothetical protein
MDAGMEIDSTTPRRENAFAECRFIRLIQTGKKHNGGDYLVVRAFEIFGSLLE